MKIKDQPNNICSICGVEYQGPGSNSWPINTGQCCEFCDSLVLSTRINYHRRGIVKPQWFTELKAEVQKHGQLL